MNNDLTLNNILYIESPRAEANLVSISRANTRSFTSLYGTHL